MINSNSGQLKPTPPFDFNHSLAFLGFFTPTKNEQSLAGQILTKAVCVQGQVVGFQVKSSGDVETPCLDYTLWSEQPLTAEIVHATLDRLSFFLSLDDDLRPFYALGRDDPAFAAIIERLYGYHQVKFLTPFEIACWAILTQRTPMALAHKMKGALTRQYGGVLTLNETAYWAFPEPDSLIEADVNDLAVLVHHTRRAEYLYAAAQAFADADEAFLRTAPVAEVKAWLRQIKGIGEWSADFILVRGLGRMECLPGSEKRLLETASRIYGHGQPLSRMALEQLAARYDPWPGYWSHYLRVGGDN